MSYMGFGGLDMMFNIVPIMICAGFIFVFGTVVYSMINTAKDKKKPIIPVRSKVVAKRTQIKERPVSHNDMHHHMHTTTHYYATFEFENGERIELSIPSQQIGYIVEGDTGILSFQGNLFVKFERM